MTTSQLQKLIKVKLFLETLSVPERAVLLTFYCTRPYDSTEQFYLGSFDLRIAAIEETLNFIEDGSCALSWVSIAGRKTFQGFLEYLEENICESKSPPTLAEVIHAISINPKYAHGRKPTEEIEEY